MHRDSEEGEDTEEDEGEELEEPENVDPRSLLTREQVQYFKDIFAELDVNKKERIPAKNIGLVLRLMGLNPTKAEIKKHIAEIDPNNKGTVDFYSFLLPIAQRINQEPETHEDIIAAFSALDEEENEFIYTDQMTEFLTNFGEDLEDFEIELFLKMAETKGTGKIRYVEFVEKMMGISRKSPKGKKGGDKGNKGKKK